MKENIALFDLDGTLCDYEKSLVDKMNSIRSPDEDVLVNWLRDDVPQYMRARANLIRASEDWWANLKPLALGFDILKMAEEIGFRIMILTAGPKRNPAAWSGKKKWIDKNLGEDVDVTMTRDKGLVYGRVLVDDYPDYVERWLEWRPRGLVIMPAGHLNKGFEHPQVIRYDGRNYKSTFAELRAKYLSEEGT